MWHNKYSRNAGRFRIASIEIRHHHCGKRFAINESKEVSDGAARISLQLAGDPGGVKMQNDAPGQKEYPRQKKNITDHRNALRPSGWVQKNVNRPGQADANQTDYHTKQFDNFGRTSLTRVSNCGRKAERKMHCFAPGGPHELRDSLLDHNILSAQWRRNLTGYDYSRLIQRHERFATICQDGRLFEFFLYPLSVD
jgi:hypothetical protein